MVLSEVQRDPPSPFLTVQAGCEGVVLPAVTPPADDDSDLPTPFAAGPQQHSGGCSARQLEQQLQQLQQLQQQHQLQLQQQQHSGAYGRRGAADARSHLQSIVSQQSLNFSVAPPDSPLEFELALSSIAAAAGGPAEQAKHQQLLAAAAAAGHGGSFSEGGAADAAQAAEPWRHRGLRSLLPARHGWLRSTRSLPQCSSLQQRKLAQVQQVQEEASCGPGSLQEQEQQHSHHHALGRKLKTRVHKLLSWAGGRHPAPGAGDCHAAHTPSPLSDGGAVIVDAASIGSSSNSQQQQHVPVPWQHQLFSEPPAQLLNTTSVPPQVHMMRSPRTSLVSSPSSCDCPTFHGRYSSAGSDSNFGASSAQPSAGPTPCSLISSMASTPSPGKLSGGGAAGPATAADVSGGGAAGPLMVTSSVRAPHHRHRHHRPGCRFYPQPQQQQSPLSNGGASMQQLLPQQPQPHPPAGGQQQQLHPQQPLSPSSGLLQPQSSLRTALQQLESMASLKASRIMDKLNAGLLKMTSQRVFDGMSLKRVTVGKEVLRDWEFGPHLGMGASCVTRLVTERTSGRPAACKSISKQGILRSAAVKAALLGVQREVAILQASLGHPHVVQLQAVYEDVHNLHMILEWCVGGSLFSLMERCQGYRLPEAAAAAATRATLEVLAHCHARGVMHRDIKPDNLLIAKPLDDAQQLTPDLVKVTDFGISLPFTPGTLLDELAGTPGYMAPEVLQRCYDEQADVWSTGVMLYEMVTGRLPFPGGNTFEEYLSGIQDNEPDLGCPEWQGVSEQARELVAAMLTKDPRLRPTAHKLLHNYSAWLNSGGSAAPEQQQQQAAQGQGQPA